MIRSAAILATALIFGGPALADESAVIGNLPAGVIVYDAVAAPVVETNVQPAAPAILAPVTQSLASTRSSFAQPVQSGAILNPAVIAPQVDLAPGETVLRAIAVPSAIVKIPNPQPAYTLTSGPPPASRPSVRVARDPILDPVKGRLRDTAGWTGRREGPASIGCFPAGACAVLNQR